MIKKFFSEHSHLKLALQQLGVHGGAWRIQVYNTTWDCGVEPIYEHYVTNDTIENLNVDFETAIMTPIINWWEDIQEERRKEKEINTCTNCNGRGHVGYYEYDPEFKQAFLAGTTECKVCNGRGYL